MPVISEESWERIDPLICWLHTQSDISVLQSGFLKHLATIIPHRKSFFDLCTTRDGRLFFFDPVSNNMTDEELETYYQEYQYSDYVAWSFSSDKPTVYRDSDMVTPKMREGSAIYRQWMDPMNIYYSIGSTVMGAHHLLGSVTLFRSREEGDFTDEEVSMLTVLNRHLSAHFAFLWPDGATPKARVAFGQLAAQYALSEREQEIAKLISQGRTNQEIGKALFISENTVKKHVNSLYRKMGITSRTQLLYQIYNHPAIVVPPN